MTSSVTLSRNSQVQNSLPSVTLGHYTFPHEVVLKILSFSEPKKILSTWALLSKKFYRITNSPYLWELVGKIFPPFNKRHIKDLTTYNRLYHLHHKINCIKDVFRLDICLPEQSVFLGVLGEYFLFRKFDGEIGYYSLSSDGETLKEIQKIPTRCGLFPDITIKLVSFSYNSLLICYTDHILEVWKNVDEEAKHYRILPHETIEHSISMHCTGTEVFFVISKTLYKVDNWGVLRKILFLNTPKGQVPQLFILNQDIEKIPVLLSIVTLNAVAQINNENFVLGTNRGELFSWNINKESLEKLCCNVDGLIYRIDSDHENNPNYILICTHELIICFNFQTKKQVEVEIHGYNVISITFQKNAFFVGDVFGNLYKCDVFSPIPILIYRGKKSDPHLTLFSQAWVGVRLYFAIDNNTLKAIDFSSFEQMAEELIRGYRKNIKLSTLEARFALFLNAHKNNIYSCLTFIDTQFVGNASDWDKASNEAKAQALEIYLARLRLHNTLLHNHLDDNIRDSIIFK